MARYILLEALPWKIANGSPEAVRLAGGGAKPYSGLRGFTDWRSGVSTFPMFVAAAGYAEKGWTGGAIPQTSQIRIFPSDETLRSNLLSLYHWKGAPIEIRSGDDDVPGVYLMELTGIVDNISVSEGSIVLTVADVAAKLNTPVVTGKYAGTGGIEGPAEAEGRPKRRSWGFVRNIEGFLLDKPNNIFEFGDYARPLNEFVTVRDMGRDAAPTPTIVTWQGSIAATFSALQASSPAQGSCVVAPSIACVKWWTQPVGPLTADIEGEVGASYVDKIADIASRIVGSVAPLLGPEIVLNGDGSNGTTDWTASGGSVSNVGGKIRVTSTGSAGAGIQAQNGVLTVGKNYRFAAKMTPHETDRARVRFFTSLSTFPVYYADTVGGVVDFTFAADAANIQINLEAASVSNFASNGEYADFDNVSLREVFAPVATADVTAINTARPAVSGIHIGDGNETTAQALDRLLTPCNVLWTINPDGSIRLGEVQLTTAISEVLTAIDVERADTFKPVWQTKLGYKRNHRQHSDGEISAALLLGNVTGPSESTSFQYDYLGAADFGGSRDLTFRLLWGDGTALTSGVTWEYRVLSGTVNTKTAADGWQSASGTGLGTVTVSSLGSDTASIEVKATYSNEPKSITVQLTKVYSPAPTGGTGGGGGTMPITKSSGFTSINSTTFTDITGTLSGTMPTGKTTAQLAASLSFMPVVSGGDGSWTIELKWQRNVSGTWTDIGSPAVVSDTSTKYTDGEGMPARDPASITNNKSDTGLTAGNNYDWRLVARLTSGTRSHNVSGSLSVTAP